MLISVNQLQVLIDSEQSFTLFDCQFDLMDVAKGFDLYQNQHIPGASYLDLEEDLSGTIVQGVTGRHPLPGVEQLQALAARVKPNSQIVVYDQANSLFAARAWFLFHLLGFEQVYILDGGLKAWLAAGAKTEQGIVQAELHLVARMQINTQLIASLPEVVALSHSKQNPVQDKQFQLVDARAAQRFRGEIEPIDAKAGHIPGAVCFDCTQNLDKSGQFLSKAQLAERFAGLNSTQPIHYCGSGVTACHNFFAMTLAGLNPGKIYPGSWSEWITDSSRPIATGDEGVNE